MVGHEDILMQVDMRKPSRQRDPHRLCNLPWALQSDLAIDNRAEYQAMVLCTDGDEEGLSPPQATRFEPVVRRVPALALAC